MGESPIYMRITNNRKHKYISTGIFVFEKFWNEKKEVIKKSHRLSNSLNQTLHKIIEEARQVQSELKVEELESAKTIRDRLKSNSKTDFFQIGKQLSQEYIDQKKLYPQKTLQVVLKKVRKFEGEEYLPLKRIDVEWLNKFEAFLKREYGNGKTTISKNFEPIRKIIDIALRESVISKNPFLLFKGARREAAKSRTKLSINQIKAIEGLELPQGSKIWHSRNAFIFSFYSGGIRFGDVCCLKWDNVKEDRLKYKMNKTQMEFSIEMNKNQIEILSLYKGEDFEYIFPFLKRNKIYDPVTLRKAINSQNVMVNNNLKKIGKLLEIDSKISFHVSRHSFAQHAIELGLDIYEIMQTLRHTKVGSTQNYIKGFDGDLADKAMKKVFG